MIVRISKAASILGVSIKTMRRWDKNGRIKAWRTAGGHRRYDIDALIQFRECGIYSPAKKNKTNCAAIYGRVSSHKQKEDLTRQIRFLEEKAREDGYKPIVYRDIGSGLNDKRRGLRKLVRDTMTNKFDRVYITYLDRPARFGTQIILDLFDINGIEYEVAHVPKSNEFNKILVMDMIALVTSFSGKLYRSRRGKNNQNKKTDFRPEVTPKSIG